MTARLSAVVAWLLTVAAVAAGQTPGADPVVATIGGIPVRLSETPGQIRLPAPEFGQHTEEVLTELLGYTWDDIARLRADGVI